MLNPKCYIEGPSEAYPTYWLDVDGEYGATPVYAGRLRLLVWRFSGWLNKRVQRDMRQRTQAALDDYYAQAYGEGDLVDYDQ